MYSGQGAGEDNTLEMQIGTDKEAPRKSGCSEIKDQQTGSLARQKTLRQISTLLQPKSTEKKQRFHPIAKAKQESLSSTSQATVKCSRLPAGVISQRSNRKPGFSSPWGSHKPTHGRRCQWRLYREPGLLTPFLQ